MSHRFSLIIGLIIVAIAATYFWWRSQAEQQINRQVDLFTDTVQFEKLSLGSVDDRNEACRKLFADKIEVNVPYPAPSGTYSQAELIAKMDEAYNVVTFVGITEHTRSIVVDGDTAQVIIEGDVRVAAGPNFHEDFSGFIDLFFVNEGSWKIDGVTVRSE